MVPAGQRMEEACREYQSSLEDLTFNSKPHINMLTILAEENVGFAKDIVAIIEAQISKAPAAEKLPVLYLVDSIVKNVGGEFIAVFAKNIITSFICVFEKVDENTRKSLFKLRSTWEEVFPLKKLYQLDVRINSLDPAWPIKPLPPTVNASIHVNPRFLKQSEEVSSPAAVAPAPPPALSSPPPPSTVSQSSVTQEQLIRQQLLAKQKQLLELQQKKIELELEQTKAQLAGGFTLPNMASTPPPSFSTAPKPVSQPTFMVRPWIPSPAPTDTKPSTRDPRLNRPWPPVSTAHKELPAGKKDGLTATSHTTPEKKMVDKPSRPDRTKTPRKDSSEDKSRKEDKIRNVRKDGLEDKPKASTAKDVQIKNKPAEAELHKAADGSKKDPRLKKRPLDKTGDAKDEDQKEKKRFCDRKEREETQRAISKAKLLNGSVAKQDDIANDKTTFKMGGNARLHPRKRSRSRSPAASPKRKDRRSPKSRTRSNSLSPSPSRKVSKPRRGRADEPLHVKPGREDRLGLKKNQSEARRSKRPAEDRRSESRDSHSPRGHEGGVKDSKEALQRWKSGWEENKHQKMGGVGLLKGGAQRHKPYSALNRPSTPRTPKHRLSVDSNLQIPDVLNSASKKDLLRRAGKRLESGEITQEEFLNMAHQIKHFFQYQEEKQQRSDSWDETLPFGKQPLLSSPTAPNQGMDQAELSYYEHKSKLRKTQVNHRLNTEEWEGNEEGVDAGKGEKTSGGRSIGVPPMQKYGRTPRDRAGEQRSKEREEARPSHAMIDDYNHGKEFPPLKSLPGLRFRRRADPRDTSEREWTSPLTERQHLDMRDENKSSYDAPRRYGSLADPRRPEGQRNCPSPAGHEAGGPLYERVSPLKDVGDLSPCFESPNSEHSDDATPPTLKGVPPPHLLKGQPRGTQLLVRQHGSSPTHTPPLDGGTGPSHYNGPAHMAPSRPLPWYEGGGPQVYKDSKFEGPQPPGPGRFEGRLHLERTDQGPIRAGDGMVRFEGPPQGPGGFMGQQPPLRFDAQGPGMQHLEAPMPRFEVPHHFNNMAPPTTCGPLGPVPSSAPPQGFQQPVHFEGPSRFESPVRFEGPGPRGPRFDMPHQAGAPRFEYTPGQQQGPRFTLQHPLHPPVRAMVQPMFEGPMAPQQNFPLGPQRFPEPINPQFPAGGQMGFQQPNLQHGGGFNLQPAFNQPGTFYQHTQQTEPPLNLLGNTFQSFINPGPFSQQAPSLVVENHLSQVDVNDLLSKLISTGIIKSSQPDAAAPPSGDLASEVPAARLIEEEEEEEQEEEEDDLPDLTAFNVDDMKQRVDSVVMRLYSGNQCCLCSMRFTAAQTDLYADHLDWHFRQNHAGKVPSKKVTHRRWYYSLTDWIEFEEIADLEERAKSHFFEKENEEEVQKNQAAAKEKEFQSVRATKDQVGECCEICEEPFETYWVEEEEDWFLKNAVRVDDKNFHPSCFEDYSRTSSYLDTPPSPNQLQSEHNQPSKDVEHSLETQEADEATSCLVKQEVKSECEQAS